MNKFKHILQSSILVTSLIIHQSTFINSMAQAPEKMSYQAVVRDGENRLMANAEVNVIIHILQGSVADTGIYAEEQNATTNANGLITIAIGSGTVIKGTFANIDWSKGPYFIKTEIHSPTNSEFQLVTTSQLMSVPYALHAKTAENPGGWSTSGNSGTNPSSDFIGTTDKQPIAFRVNNNERMRLDSNGNLSFFGTGKSVFIGQGAGENDDLVNNFNVFIGDFTGYSNDNGYGNTVTGYSALYSNISGRFNTAFGYKALYSNKAGGGNIAIGDEALISNVGGGYNTAVGSEALYYNKDSYNVAVGELAMQYNTIGKCNRACGRRSLWYNTSGSFNTAIGNDAGPAYSDSTLSNTGAFGYQATPTASNTIRIGNNYITQIGGKVGWSNLSDGRFKTNVNKNVPGLDFILKLQPVTFNWDLDALEEFKGVTDSISQNEPEMQKAKKEKETKVYTGFIAQEVEKAANECNFDFSAIVKPSNDKTPYNLTYAEFVVPLVKAIQEQQQMILQQQKLNNEQQQVIQSLKKEIEILKSAGN